MLARHLPSNHLDGEVVVKEILEEVMDIAQERVSERNGQHAVGVSVGSRKSMSLCSYLRSWNRS